MSIARNRLIDASQKQEEKKPLILTEGMEFTRKEGETDLIISRIDTHYKDKDGKKQKYTEPIIHMTYIGLGGSGFTTPANEVQRMVYLERWSVKK